MIIWWALDDLAGDWQPVRWLTVEFCRPFHRMFALRKLCLAYYFTPTHTLYHILSNAHVNEQKNTFKSELINRLWCEIFFCLYRSPPFFKVAACRAENYGPMEGYFVSNSGLTDRSRCTNCFFLFDSILVS